MIATVSFVLAVTFVVLVVVLGEFAVAEVVGVTSVTAAGVILVD